MPQGKTKRHRHWQINKNTKHIPFQDRIPLPPSSAAIPLYSSTPQHRYSRCTQPAGICQGFKAISKYPFMHTRTLAAYGTNRRKPAFSPHARIHHNRTECIITGQEKSARIRINHFSPVQLRSIFRKSHNSQDFLQSLSVHLHSISEEVTTAKIFYNHFSTDTDRLFYSSRPQTAHITKNDDGFIRNMHKNIRMRMLLPPDTGKSPWIPHIKHLYPRYTVRLQMLNTVSHFSAQKGREYSNPAKSITYSIQPLLTDNYLGFALSLTKPCKALKTPPYFEIQLFMTARLYKSSVTLPSKSYESSILWISSP